PHPLREGRDNAHGAVQMPWSSPVSRREARGAVFARHIAARGTDIRPADVRGLAGSGFRPPVMDAVVSALPMAGQRPTVHGGVFIGLAAAGQRPTVHGGLLWPVPP